MTKSKLEHLLRTGAKMNELFDFSDGQECLIYKGNWSLGEEIIYIPDIFLNEIPTDRKVREDELEGILHCCYTGDDFLNECGGDEALAKRLFSYCDWQNPSAAVDEVRDDDE